MITIFTVRSLCYKKFAVKAAEAYMDMRLKERASEEQVQGQPVQKVEFENTTTEFAWTMFQMGWASHPNFDKKVAFILGRVDEDKVEMAANPSIHVRAWSANKEADRLSKKHSATFAVFATNDPRVAELGQRKMDDRIAKGNTMRAISLQRKEKVEASTLVTVGEVLNVSCK